MTTCLHARSGAQVNVTRVQESGAFVASVQIMCMDCRQRFSFTHLPRTDSLGKPCSSDDGLEARLPLSITD